MKILACLLFSLTLLLPADRPEPAGQRHSAKIWRTAESANTTAVDAVGAKPNRAAEFGAADAQFLVSFLESFRSRALPPGRSAGRQLCTIVLTKRMMRRASRTPIGEALPRSRTTPVTSC